jgi:protein-tyrosine phosphatase
VIDLHSHILPGVDDGAPDLATSLEMARAWVADGVTCVACTPHILPGLYHNRGPDILAAVEQLAQSVADAGIPLLLVAGADNHVVPSFVSDLRSGHLLTLAGSRYVLVEPPHHIMPSSLEYLFMGILSAGYVPILTHPERLTWINGKYDVVQRLAGNGVWMQITAGSITGAFGRSAQYWAERMMDEALVHIIATDAHDLKRRPPVLAAARLAAERRLGAREAQHLVETRPAGVLRNIQPDGLPKPLGVKPGTHVGTEDYGQATRSSRRRGLFSGMRRFFGR